MPGLHHPVLRPLGGDGEAEQLARQAHGVVADVDHLLDLAQALRADLAGLQGHQPSELGLVRAQLLAEQPHELSAPRGRDLAPGEECLVRPSDCRAHPLRARVAQAADGLAGDRRPGGDRSAGPDRAGDAEPRQQRARLGAGRGEGVQGGGSGGGVAHALARSGLRRRAGRGSAAARSASA